MARENLRHRFVLTAAEIIALMSSTDPAIRRWAVRYILRVPNPIRNDRVLHVLERSLFDVDEQVSAGAILILQKHGIHAAVRALLEKYRRSTGLHAGQSARALGVLGEEELVRVFAEKRLHRDLGPIELRGVWEGLGSLHTEASRQMLRSEKRLLMADPNRFISILELPAIEQALLRHLAREDFADALVSYQRFRASLPDNGAGLIDVFLTGLGLGERAAEFRSELPRQLRGDIEPEDHVKPMLDERSRRRLAGLLGRGRLGETIVMAAGLALSRCCQREHGIVQEDLFGMELLRGALMVLETIKKDRCVLGEVAGLSLRALERVVARERIVGADGTELLALLAGGNVAPGDSRLFLRRARETTTAEAIANCLAGEIEHEKSGWRAVAAARMLGAIGSAATVGPLLNALQEDRSDDLCEAAMESLVLVGRKAVAGLREALSVGDFSQVIYSLGALEKIPSRQAIAAVVDSFEDLWTEHREPLLVFISRVGSRDFLPLVRRKMSEEHTEGLEVYKLLCRLHGEKPRVSKPRRAKPGVASEKGAFDALSASTSRRKGTSAGALAPGAFSGHPKASARPNGAFGERGEPGSGPPRPEGRVLGFLEAYYGRWVDAPLKALGYRSPREAVKTAAGRKRVEKLLEGMAESAPGSRSAEHLRWLRHELGLPDGQESG